jgi:hypothetical protein
MGGPEDPAGGLTDAAGVQSDPKGAVSSQALQTLTNPSGASCYYATISFPDLVGDSAACAAESAQLYLRRKISSGWGAPIFATPVQAQIASGSTKCRAALVGIEDDLYYAHAVPAAANVRITGEEVPRQTPPCSPF